MSFYRHGDDQTRDGDAIDGGSHALPTALFMRVAVTWRIPGT